MTFLSRTFQRFPVWLTVAFLVLPLRLFLMTLPAPGRDEAAYFYWSNHFEPAYASLLQITLRLFSFLPFPELVNLRLPSLLLGVFILFLLDKIARSRGMPWRHRLLAVSCIGLTPWQTYAGVVVHPDNYQLAVLLLFVLASQKKNYMRAAVLSGMSVLAKPSGLIILGAALLFFSLEKLDMREKIKYVSTAIFVAAPAILTMHIGMVRAVSEYGRINASASTGEVLIWSLLPTIFFGGPLLFAAAIQGIRGFWLSRTRRNEFVKNEQIIYWLGLAFIVIFGGAAILRGQIKENWILPGFVLLWPAMKLRLPKAFVVSGFSLTAFASIFIALMFHFPHLAGALETKFSGAQSTYQVKAGGREMKYSQVNSWRSRLREYQSIASFSEEILQKWQASNPAAPRVIVSDDYGLAAQLVFRWKKLKPKMVIPGDGIFHHTVPESNEFNGDVLILAVHKAPAEVWNRLQGIEIIGQVRHPATGGHVVLATCSKDLAPIE